jgi:bla regulator protein BlaR1
MMRAAADTLFPLLASGALKGAVLLLAAMGVARLLRNQPAAVRHAVWTMALAGVLLLPALSLAPGLPTLDAPVAGLAAFDADRPLALRAPWERDAATPQASMRSEDGIAAQAPARVRLADALVVLWILGAALALVREAAGQARASRLAARAMADAAPSIRDAMRDAVRESGGRAVLVRLSDEVGGPVTLGVLRPMILLPTGAAEWPAERLRPALLHELAHVARRDCATDLIARLACALWWFNPLVWTALRRARAERERACDDRVLAARVQPVGYAALLVDVARLSRGRPIPSAAHALPMAQRMSELESRLRAILDPSIPRTRPSRGVWIVLSAGAMLSVAACAAVRLEAAPPLPAIAPVRAMAGGTVATAPEPDLAGDSLSHPASERISGHAGRMRDALAAPALRGPDSAWAARLREGLADDADGPADLVRERAAWALTRAEGGRLMEPMLRALADADWRVRSYAAWALAQSADGRVVRPLLPLLDDRVWRVRAMAAFAVAQFADPAAEPAMRAAMDDPAWQVRTSAVEYFGGLRSAEHLPLLRARLADRHPAVRGAAQDALDRDPS